MMAPREFYHADDHVVITVDIEDCPLVEFPLVDLFDIVTSTVVDNYLEVVQDYVTQVLEDTTWLDKQTRLCLLRARLCVYHRRHEGELLTLRQPALQRSITQMLRCRNGTHCHPIEVPLFIRFKQLAITLPCKTRFPTDMPPVHIVGRSNAMIRSDGVHDFDSRANTPIPDVHCPSTPKVSTLAEITRNPLAESFANREDSTACESTLDGSDTTMGVPFVTIKDFDYNTPLPMTPLEGTIAKNGRHVGFQFLQFLSFDTVPQHTAVPTTHCRFVEHQNGGMIFAAVFAMTGMGTLPHHVPTPTPFWSNVSCQTTIEDCNRLLLPIGMRFHPIDRGRLLVCTG
jgi:hypothetical protein